MEKPFGTLPTGEVVTIDTIFSGKLIAHISNFGTGLVLAKVKNLPWMHR